MHHKPICILWMLVIRKLFYRLHAKPTRMSCPWPMSTTRTSRAPEAALPDLGLCEEGPLIFLRDRPGGAAPRRLPLRTARSLLGVPNFTPPPSLHTSKTAFAFIQTHIGILTHVVCGVVSSFCSCTIDPGRGVCMAAMMAARLVSEAGPRFWGCRPLSRLKPQAVARDHSGSRKLALSRLRPHRAYAARDV